MADIVEWFSNVLGAGPKSALADAGDPDIVVFLLIRIGRMVLPIKIKRLAIRRNDGHDLIIG